MKFNKFEFSSIANFLNKFMFFFYNNLGIVNGYLFYLFLFLPIFFSSPASLAVWEKDFFIGYDFWLIDEISVFSGSFWDYIEASWAQTVAEEKTLVEQLMRQVEKLDDKLARADAILFQANIQHVRTIEELVRVKQEVAKLKEELILLEDQYAIVASEKYEFYILIGVVVLDIFVAMCNDPSIIPA